MTQTQRIPPSRAALAWDGEVASVFRSDFQLRPVGQCLRWLNPIGAEQLGLLEGGLDRFFL